MRAPASHPPGLSRRTQGLSDADKQFVRLLAEIAVNEYLRETESADIADEPVMARREATR